MMVNAARLKDSGERNDVAAGMAKYLASEFCAEVTQQSFRIHGGYGYSKEYEIERLMRDAPFLLIGEGTSEIQKQIISKRLLATTGSDVSAPEFAPRPQLAEDVARFVRPPDLQRHLSTGKYIRLEQLADELGISVTPVREALFGLGTEGAADPAAAPRLLVFPSPVGTSTTSRPYRGHIGASWPSGRPTGSPPLNSSPIWKDQRTRREAYAANDYERAVRLNHEFHRGINVAADSPKLAQLMSQITCYALESVFPAVDGGRPTRRATIGGCSRRCAERRRRGAHRDGPASVCRGQAADRSPGRPGRHRRLTHVSLARR